MNSKLVIITDWNFTNSASVKTLAMDWGGSNVSGPAYTTTAGVKLMIEIINANSLVHKRYLMRPPSTCYSFGSYLVI